MEYWGFWTWTSKLVILAVIALCGRYIVPEMIRLWKAKNYRWFWAYSPFVLAQTILLGTLIFEIIRHVTGDGL